MYSVFLVDDDTLILDELIDTILWLDNGFTVVGSETNPFKAVDKIKELQPDVVFVDLKMPGMDGNGLIKTLKKNGTICEYVMISAYDNFENVRAFLLIIVVYYLYNNSDCFGKTSYKTFRDSSLYRKYIR